MGHTKLEIDVYSCRECGWVGTEPRVVKAQELMPNEMGSVRNGSRGGQLWHRFECPLCYAPITPSHPVDLVQVAAVDERKKAPGSNGDE